jgi:broad specificity phosphatase PhoE
MTKARTRLAFAALLVAMAGPAGARGFRGLVRQRLADGGLGPVVADVALRFVKEDHSLVRSAISDASGRYQVTLPAGRYFVTAASVGFEDYSSAPGFFVVTGSSFQTGNVFLRQPRVTVVLAVRHADRDGSNDALTAAGVERAKELAEVASKAGVSAVYATATVRARETARPLAERRHLEVQEYANEADAADKIAAGHAGDVVLVIGHSNTTTGLAEAVLGENLYPASPNPLTDDFDNLLVIAKPVGGAAGSVVNLQYGADSAPDTPDLSRARTTNILLLRHAETSGAGLSAAGQARATELAHVAKKAGASALFAPTGSPAAATLAPVATAAGLTTTSYDPANLPALVSQIFAGPAGKTVLVAGDRATLQGLVGALKASPVPPLAADEFDHLMLMVATGPGEARLVSLQYGAHRP